MDKGSREIFCMITSKTSPSLMSNAKNTVSQIGCLSLQSQIFKGNSSIALRLNQKLQVHKKLKACKNATFKGNFEKLYYYVYSF
jgi:hypothetical protein